MSIESVKRKLPIKVKLWIYHGGNVSKYKYALHRYILMHELIKQMPVKYRKQFLR